ILLLSMLCQFKCSVRERSGVPSQDRDIDRLRPAVGHVVVDIAATHQCDKSPAALLDGASLSASFGVMPRHTISGQTFLTHRRDGPTLKRIIRRVDEIRLSRFADARPEKDPRVCAFDQVRSTLEICIHPEKPEFVTA